MASPRAAIRIGSEYDMAVSTCWKDGPSFPAGTRVAVVGLHLSDGFCLRFPGLDRDGGPLETWEAWDDVALLAEIGTATGYEVSPGDEGAARAVLADAEPGSHTHIGPDD